MHKTEASGGPAHISRPRAARLRLLAGKLNGLIALGGGVLITPLLVVAGVGPQTAVGTSLVAMRMLSCIGSVTHPLLGGMALDLVLILAAVSRGAVGSVLGSRIIARLTTH